MKKFLLSLSSLVVVLFSINSASATTIGTNISTTGTFTLTAGSATAVQIQNAAGTVTTFVVDTTNGRVGIGGTPSTTFEVQGTASASYFLAGNTIQVSGYASAAYSRFGTNTTTGNFLINTNDLLISGRLEVDASVQFDKHLEVQGTASASYFITGNTIQVGGFASVAYSRFGTTATSHVGTVSDTDDLLINGGFEVDGSAAFDGFALFSSGASVTTSFELTTNSKLGVNSGAVTNNTLEIGGTASISGIASVSSNFNAGFGVAGSSAFVFDNKSTTVGGCIVIKDNDGSGYTFLRVSNGAGTFSSIDCR